MKKIISLIAAFGVLLNTLIVPVSSLAQTIEPSATPTSTPTDLATPTSAPTTEPSIIPSTTPTPTPGATLLDSPTPTPEITATPSPTPSTTTTPAVTTTEIDNVSLSGVTGLEPIGTITTDQPDYSPTSLVLITGSGFKPNYTYTIVISSDSTPSVNSQDQIVTDSAGNFSYSYRLDSYYRPIYQIQILDGGRVVTTSSFTDKPAATLDQCANLGSVCDTAHPAQWQNGNLGQSQATYSEGDSVPYRAIITGLTAGQTYTLDIEYDTTQNGKHAIDYLTSFNRTVSTADPLAGVSGLPASPTTNTRTIPTDTYVTGAGVTPIAGNFTIYNGSISAVSSYTLSGTYADSSSTSLTLTFSPTADGTAVIAWGGHISTRADWGLLNSAVDISGSPYHMRLIDFTCSNVDNCGVGNQDRSLSSEAVIFPGSITIIKNATPNGSTSFGFTASPSPLFNFSLVDDGTSANTRLFSNITNFQTYTINENSIPAGWGFDSVSCSATSPNGGSYTTSTTSVNINIKEGENWTCTYLDSLRTGTLTVIKHVINDNGGTAVAGDFTLHVKSGSSDVSGSPAAGSETGTNYSLVGGTYVVSENTPPTGYTMTGFSGDCDSGGSVTLAAGQTKTCTITNNDNAPVLHLRKLITNDNGGTATLADFTLTANGTGSNDLSGTSPVDSGATLKADTFALSESSVTGYSAGSWVCVGGTQNGSNITLGIGQEATCTITNNDIAPKLTVTKVVENDFGGTAAVSDFTLYIDTTEVTSGVQNSLSAGTYTVSEGTLPSGYQMVGITGDCAANGSITLAVGDVKSCTITNHDIEPKLTLVKTVVNDNGGSAVISDFPLFVDTTSVTSGVKNGFNAGSYTASETEKTGYAASSWGGDCAADGSITLSVGDDKTCTITNNDIQPQLTLVKTVINDNGGNKQVSDFPLFVNATGVTSGVANGFNAGTYTASETQQSGYSASAWGGDCAAGGSVTLSVGDNKTCTITNNDIAPKLTLVKTVVNDNGGSKTVSNFPLFISGTPATSGVTYTQTANIELTASETSQTGYAASAWGGDCAADGTITLLPGDDKTCTITNDDIAPKLHLRKTVVNDNGGTATVSNFTLSADGTGSNDLSGTSPVDSGATLQADTFALSETNFTGYSPSSWNCVGGSQNGSDITVGIGQEATCTITNDDISPILTIVKDAEPNDCQDFTFNMTGQSSFQLDDDSGVIDCLDTNQPQSKTFTNLTAGQNISVTETLPDVFWSLSSVSCVITNTTTPFATTGLTNGVILNMNLADNVTCTFSNITQAPTRTLGFWQTHTAFTSGVFTSHFPTGMQIGVSPNKGTITNIQSLGQSQLFGAYYANISMTTNGKGKSAKRSSVDQARMVLLQQLVTAKLNCAEFSCPLTIQAAIAGADSAYASGNVPMMQFYTSQLDIYNNGGDTITIGSAGSATPQLSKGYADIAFWNNP